MPTYRNFSTTSIDSPQDVSFKINDNRSIHYKPNQYQTGMKWIDPIPFMFATLYGWGKGELSFNTWLDSCKNSISFGIFSFNNISIFSKFSLILRTIPSVIKYSFKQRM